MSGLLQVAAVVLAAGAALFSLGLLATSIFDDVLDAAGATLAIALVASAGILVAGPRVITLPRPVLYAALIASPIVTASAAAEFDLFRTPALYRLSPIAHTSFDYPTWSAAASAYLSTAMVAGAAATYVRTRRG